MWGLPTGIIALQIMASTSPVWTSLTKAVGIVYVLWGLLFASHCHDRSPRLTYNRWRSWFWELIHLPLQIGIALFLAAIGVGD